MYTYLIVYKLIGTRNTFITSLVVMHVRCLFARFEIPASEKRPAKCVGWILAKLQNIEDLPLSNIGFGRFLQPKGIPLKVLSVCYVTYVQMLNKQLLFKGSAVALLSAVLLKMVDLEKLWPVLSDMSDCATLIAAVFVADTIVFHAVPRLMDFWKNMKKVDVHVDLDLRSYLPRYDMHLTLFIFSKR